MYHGNISLTEFMISVTCTFAFCNNSVASVYRHSFTKAPISSTTSSSKTFKNETKQSCYQHSQKKSDKQSLARYLETPWLARQSAPPWTTYQRPSETSTSQIQEKTETDSLADFYKCSTRATKTWIREQNNKKRSHSA